MCYAQMIQQIAVSVKNKAIGIPRAIQGEQMKRRQWNMARDNAMLQTTQVKNNLMSEADAAAERSFQLARAALQTRGRVQASPLGDNSVRAISRAIGFELGQDTSILEKNVELANQAARARLAGIDLTLADQKLQIGDIGEFSKWGAMGAAWFDSPVDAGSFQGIPATRGENSLNSLKIETMSQNGTGTELSESLA